MAVVLQRRVDFPMIDLAKVVFYPEYFDLAHRFFEESWELICGIDYPTITQEMHLGFPAVRTESDHISPLRYGDQIQCKIWIESVGNSSITWRYQFSNQKGILCWDAKVVTVCVNMKTFEKQSVPAEIAERLQNCTEH
ncbi:MAG: thioesterase family protein [Candidatus Thalassarchaeaceae archaeon]|jgi:YbgC/YbaW family acyl-CoA thioester hydrolase|nr:thioesterase family protein [Candidatus Thalassarchaeaceae archaeon]